VHPKIDNPDYIDDNEIYAFPDLSYIGLEIWQVKAGTIFDHILVTDDIAEAEKAVAITDKAREAEKKASEKEEADKRAKEDEERKAKAAAADTTEEEEEDEEEPAEDLKDEL